MTALICDFCNAPDPPWEYMAKEIDLIPGDTVSVGSWCACTPCRELIDANDRDGLAARAKKRNGELASLRTIRMMQNRFFVVKSSSARPIKVTPMHGRWFER